MSELEQLCTSCARCCDGSKFRMTPIDADEHQRFGVVLPQPCPHLGADRRCTIYASRPSTCVKYLCPVAKALVAGEVTLEQARAQLQR